LSVVDLLKETRLLGPKKLAFRVGWEFANRTGLRARFEPIGDLPQPTRSESLARWWARLPAAHPLRTIRALIATGTAGDELRTLYTGAQLDQIVARADAVERGEITFFRAFTAQCGAPPNWHLEPRRRRSWPRSMHWSALLSHEDRNGDIKLTWELNRFIHVYDLIRAFALDERASRVETFVDHVRSWETANTFRAGVNWASGQELAVRLVSWCYGLAAFGGHDSFSEADFQRIRRLAYAHAVHIEEHLDFAQTLVPNNHLLAEALGLFVVGSTFDFDESSRWVDRAGNLFDELLEQFDADGGYCQNSHTYARFALQMWLEVVRWRPSKRYAVLPVLRRAARFIEAFVSPEGRVPNWGNNDGSVLNAWSEADYQDFRPVIAAVMRLCGEARAEATAPSRETAMWLFGESEQVREPDVPPPESDRSAPDTEFYEAGLAQRSCGEARVVVRAGPMHLRTGHADQMHVDVWFGDDEVACDAGSYSYHYDPAFHRWASGQTSHNVVTVADLVPMKLVRKFKWVGFEPAQIVHADPNSLEVEWPAYTARGVAWRRRVDVEQATVRVVDHVTCAGLSPTRRFRLHWLLTGEWTQHELCFEDAARDLELEIVVEGAKATADMVTGRNGAVRGWHARYYGVREPCTSLVVELDAPRAVITSTFVRRGDS
jgi:asparagine synthase (glutamine-hydrolysing)